MDGIFGNHPGIALGSIHCQVILHLRTRLIATMSLTFRDVIIEFCPQDSVLENSVARVVKIRRLKCSRKIKKKNPGN